MKDKRIVRSCSWPAVTASREHSTDLNKATPKSSNGSDVLENDILCPIAFGPGFSVDTTVLKLKASADRWFVSGTPKFAV